MTRRASERSLQRSIERMFSPRGNINARGSSPGSGRSEPLSPVVAVEIAAEYASLSAPDACPRGVYLTPSPDTLLRWYGVLFLHSGPYANAVLRFILSFKPDYPVSAPIIRFESEVFHPLIHPKSKEWHPQGHLAKWRPGLDRVTHLLHSLKRTFQIEALDEVFEEQAVNKQIWSLYQYSRQTFLSMTAQRALASSSARVLYPSTDPVKSTARPGSPETPRRSSAHARQESQTSSLRSKASRESLVKGEGEGYVVFRKLDDGERERLMSKLELRRKP